MNPPLRGQKCLKQAAMGIARWKRLSTLREPWTEGFSWEPACPACCRAETELALGGDQELPGRS